jgi:hypothetical protein
MPTAAGSNKREHPGTFLADLRKTADALRRYLRVRAVHPRAALPALWIS